MKSNKVGNYYFILFIFFILLTVLISLIIDILVVTDKEKCLKNVADKLCLEYGYSYSLFDGILEERVFTCSKTINREEITSEVKPFTKEEIRRCEQ